MAIIKQLDPHITNLIAAGEVIERPASVIKELVENSIDAGSTKIDITVRNAGKTYICISDNGCGMNKKDLENCILRHATSKLPTDDLMNINYLGFRGEAIPSIASVSKMKITTNDGNECCAGSSYSVLPVLCAENGRYDSNLKRCYYRSEPVYQPSASRTDADCHRS